MTDPAQGLLLTPLPLLPSLPPSPAPPSSSGPLSSQLSLLERKREGGVEKGIEEGIEEGREEGRVGGRARERGQGGREGDDEGGREKSEAEYDSERKGGADQARTKHTSCTAQHQLASSSSIPPRPNSKTPQSRALPHLLLLSPRALALRLLILRVARVTVVAVAARLARRVHCAPLHAAPHRMHRQPQHKRRASADACWAVPPLAVIRSL